MLINNKCFDNFGPFFKSESVHSAIAKLQLAEFYCLYIGSDVVTKWLFCFVAMTFKMCPSYFKDYVSKYLFYVHVCPFSDLYFLGDL